MTIFLRGKLWKTNGRRRSVGLTPVSYTHLDVYKRQLHQLNIHLDPQLMGQFSAVSYTHLDVYKRQVLNFVVSYVTIEECTDT